MSFKWCLNTFANNTQATHTSLAKSSKFPTLMSYECFPRKKTETLPKIFVYESWWCWPPLFSNRSCTDYTSRRRRWSCTRHNLGRELDWEELLDWRASGFSCCSSRSFSFSLRFLSWFRAFSPTNTMLFSFLLLFASLSFLDEFRFCSSGDEWESCGKVPPWKSSAGIFLDHWNF